jgi:dihydrodipicolinate synthase/N-acetylneuraminate lyase
MKWQGVFPAVTTPFREDLSVDLDFSAHLAGCSKPAARIRAARLARRSATLTFEEKGQILETCRRALGAARRWSPESRRCRPPKPWPRLDSHAREGCDG